MEDLKAPILTTRYERSYLTSGCWSPTRPGVFYTTKQDGTLDVWDFFYKQNAPVYSTKVTEAGLSAISAQNAGSLVAVGSMDGSTTLLQVCGSLAEPQGNEKQSITQMLERENKREKNLEMRALQSKRERKQTEKILADTTASVSTKESEHVDDSAMIAEVEKEFYDALALSQRAEGESGEGCT